MPTWEYMVLRALRVGDRWLQPGELTAIPNTWTYQVLQAHLNGGLIEKTRLLEDEEYEPQIYPTGVPEGYDDLKPTPDPRSADQYISKGQHEWMSTCVNCWERNFLWKGIDDDEPWRCWFCKQINTVNGVRASLSERVILERPSEFVGVHDHLGVSHALR